MSNPDLLSEHAERISDFVATLLDPYNRQLAAEVDSRKGGRLAARTKELNDPIWGTLQIRAEEVVYLDSPLMQRLRRVRQLGVVHLVYPAATHTRFEHSLGVVHQLQELVTSVNEHGLIPQPDSASPGSGRVISLEFERQLRLAALLHDIGHGTFSHVSEYALEDHRACDDLRNAFQRARNKAGRSQLSEIAAYFIVESRAFAELAELAARAAGLPPLPGLQKFIQNVIVGTSVDDEFLLLHEFVSGPFDADKLDYLKRDAFMCGVPVITDVPRLVQKVRATRVDREGLPTRLKRATQYKPAGYCITGVARSGGRTLDELALARTLMFDKVYRHQKVRAAEEMVFGIVQQLAQLLPDSPALLPLKFADEELMNLTENGVIQALRRQPAELSEDDRRRILIASDLASRLRDRRLFVRGMAFASVMTEDSYQYDPAHSAGLKKFLLDCARPRERDRFVKDVAQRVREIAGLLDRTDLDLPDPSLVAYIRLSPPKPPPKTASADTGHAHLIDSDGHITQVQEDAAETTAWTDAYVATRDLGHIFCPREIAPLVYIATEATIRQSYQVRLPESMLLYAKQDPKEIRNLKNILVRKGWYRQFPTDILPLPDVLLRADITDRVGRIVEAFQSYSGPAYAATAGQSDRPVATVKREQVLAFVRQFEEYTETALRVVEAVRLIGRAEANEAVSLFIAQHPEFMGASYCTLGEAKDSSTLLTYYVGDVARKYELISRSLPEALNAESPILFVDDFIGTGNQVRDIFEAWLDEKRSKDLGESRNPLAEPLRQRLRSRKLGLAFVAGMDSGLEQLASGLRHGLGLDIEVSTLIHQCNLPFINSIGLPADELDAFSDFCRKVGRRLLKHHDGKERHDEWIDERLLGYGNTGLLLASTYNTPSATLTCLWGSAAQDDDVNWAPLIPRRVKS